MAHHRRHFGRDPAGIWLPECGYHPGLDAVLAEAGIRYFFVDTHGITDATPRPRFGVGRQRRAQNVENMLVAGPGGRRGPAA